MECHLLYLFLLSTICIGIREIRCFGLHRRNPSKSEFIWCTTARRTKLIPTDSFELVGSIVLPSKSVWDLGAYIDSDMSMTTHICRLVSSCFYQADPTTVQVNSFVISRIDYCDSLLFGLPAYELHRVQHRGVIWGAVAPPRKKKKIKKKEKKKKEKREKREKRQKGTMNNVKLLL